jgi:hypothetical protein
VISRYLVIALAVVAAAFQLSRGAWLEAAGLIALAFGLICLKLSATRPSFRRTAYLSFAVTVVAMAVVFARRL